MAARREMTRARWAGVVREQERSGKTVQAFAETRGLSAATLYWWRSELKRGARHSSAVELNLAPVTLLERGEPVAPSLVAFEVTLASGHRVRVPSGFDAESLRRLIAALEGRC